MSLLPIVDRELRVASRKWGPYLARGGIASLALVLIVPGLLFGFATGGASGAGRGAFSLLSNYLFLVAAACGGWLTSDCLSGEKRQGTMGLLFLTDLKGYDVVLGKFASLGLSALYGMMAVFPALAIPLLVGGVTGAEFGRVSLALLNLLFVSLSMGMLASAISHEASRAFWIALAGLLLLLAGPPLAARLLQAFDAPTWTSYLAWINPGHAFALGHWSSGRVPGPGYWGSLGVTHAIGWLLLLGAGLVLPSSWQEREGAGAQVIPTGRLARGRFGRWFKVRRNRSGLDRNPVVWLMGDRPLLKMILWGLSGGTAACVIAACVVLGPDEALGPALLGSFVMLVFIALVLVDHACRFWVDSRQNRNLEALLVVPLTAGEILSAHWNSIRNHFLWPLMLVTTAATIPTWAALLLEVLKGELDGGRLANRMAPYIPAAAVLLWFLISYVAIGYTGMWLALKLRRPQFAGGLTLLCVVLLPLMFCWLGFGLILIFIFLPMSMLQSNLRGMILQHYTRPPVKRSTATQPGA